MDVKTTILSLKNSSLGYDELPVSIAKQCIDNYIVPYNFKFRNQHVIDGRYRSI